MKRIYVTDCWGNKKPLLSHIDLEAYDTEGYIEACSKSTQRIAEVLVDLLEYLVLHEIIPINDLQQLLSNKHFYGLSSSDNLSIEDSEVKL